MGLDNEYGSWLREMKLLQRAKEASSCRAGGINAAPGSRGTGRRAATDMRGMACSLPPPRRALQSREKSMPHAQPNQEYPVSFQVSGRYPAMHCGSKNRVQMKEGVLTHPGVRRDLWAAGSNQ